MSRLNLSKLWNNTGFRGNDATSDVSAQSFWDCVPARSASAIEHPVQTKPKKSIKNVLLSKHYKFPWEHEVSRRKNFKKKASSSGGQFGFVYGLVLLALAMWMALLMMAAKLGCFLWEKISSSSEGNGILRLQSNPTWCSVEAALFKPL